MGPLTVIYDPGCAVCRAARNWLMRQEQWTDLQFVPAGSAQLRGLFPGLDPEATQREIHVVDASGGVYRGAKAWLMCLWALRDYRGISLRYAAPERRHQAEKFVSWVARNRHRLNRGGDPAAAMVDNPCSR